MTRSKMTRSKFCRSIQHAVIVGLAAMIACAAQAATPGMDCPLAFTPYSSDTPLYDILLNPAAKAVFDRDVPAYSKFVEQFPPDFMTTKLPSFATIVTPKSFASEI